MDSMSLRFRLTLWYSSVLAVTLIICGIGLYFFLDFFVYNNVEQELKTNAEKTYSRIQPRLSLTLKGLVLDLDLQDRDLHSTNTFVQLYNVELATINKSANLQFYDVNLPVSEQILSKLETTDSFFLREKILGQRLLIYHLGIYSSASDGSNELRGILQTAIPINQYESFFTILKYMMIFIAALTILLASTLGWFLARKALSPIQQVIASANLIQIGDDLDKRIIYEGPIDDEVGRLSSTINQMLARIQVVYRELEEAYGAQRRFVSDASHELRTPLTTIRGNVELLEKMWKSSQQEEAGKLEEHQVISKEALHDIAAESQRMSYLVNDLLVLARADARVNLQKSPLEIKPLIDEVVRKANFLPRTVEWQVGDLTVLAHIQVLGNRDYLLQLLFIFIENAFKYTNKGFCKLEAQLTEHQVGISIIDTGIGMDESEIPHIFERFYRADPSRGKFSGTGLGLSIAKWIIDEHQGSIEVITSKNNGSTFMIWLPINYQHVAQ
jgi:two-component system OmpR family sensor kinase